MKIKAIAICRNEGPRIKGWAQQYAGITSDLSILLDDRTTDDSLQIATNMGVKAIPGKFRDFSSFKNMALDMFTKDAEWIIFLDIDERLSPELISELQRVQKDGFTNTYVDVYLANVRNVQNGFVHGKQFLFQRGIRFQFLVHEKLLTTNQAWITRGEIIHDRGSKPAGDYKDLMAREPYMNDMFYTARLNELFPILHIGKDEDPRILKIGKL